jgi:pimeloyl-ACP methyl ester carboxylesterase
MEIIAGRFKFQFEQPQTVKFASPLPLISDLFMRPRHLAVPIGYFVSIGWEVYAADPYESDHTAASPGPPMDWAATLASARNLITALGRDIILIGHGAGGLLALALADHPQIKAVVALAPIVPGFNSSMLRRSSGLFGLWRPFRLNPPRGRDSFELFADADAFHRDILIRDLTPASAAFARDIAAGQPSLFPHARIPSLVICGEADPFAPVALARVLAETANARFVTMPNRGHWLIGGRVLERVVAEVQRFLVLSLGRDLLLLYPDET